MDLDTAVKELYKKKGNKELIRWLEELKELRYEIQYIRNVVLPIANEKERKDRLECVAERLVKMYGI